MYEVVCLNEKNEKFSKYFYDRKEFNSFLNKCKYSKKIKVLSWWCHNED